MIFIFFSGLSAAQKTDAHVRRGNASLRREGHSFSHRDMMSTALDVGEVPIGSGSMSQCAMRHTFADGGTFCLLVVAQSRSQQLPASIPPAKSFSDRKQALRVDKKLRSKFSTSVA